MCGTMIPTKPISPLTATAAAVPSVAATTRREPHAADVDAEARRLVVAEAEHVDDAPAARRSRRSRRATYGEDRGRRRVQPVLGMFAEDPRVDLLQRLRVLLLDERLPRGEERRHGDAGEDQRRRVALAAARSGRPRT